MARKKKDDNLEIKKLSKPKSISPFDIIGMIFTNRESFNNLSNLILSKNFFMINRIFAIQFPLQAQLFNNLNVSKSDVIKCWANFAVTKLGYGKIPSFVYTKGAKAISQIKNTDNIDKDLKEQYCKHYNISLKDFDDMLYFNHDNTIKHINQFDSIFNVKINEVIKKEKIN